VPPPARIKRELSKAVKPGEPSEEFNNALAELVEGHIELMAVWIEQIAQDSPKDAFNCMMALMEYYKPKLARKESAIDITVKREDIIDRLETLADGESYAEFRYVSEVSREDGSPQGGDSGETGSQRPN